MSKHTPGPKYHARRNGQAMCGANGTAGGFNVVTLSPSEWNALPVQLRCKRCRAAIAKAAGSAS